MLYIYWRIIIPWKEVLSPPPNQPYEPKHTTTIQLTSTSANHWTLPLSSHTTPSGSMIHVAAPPIYVPLLFVRAPFRSDADPCYLSHYILCCAALWCPSMLCAVLPSSVSLCNAWHRFVPPMLLWASPCSSFKILALPRSATQKYFLIILRNLS